MSFKTDSKGGDRNHARNVCGQCLLFPRTTCLVCDHCEHYDQRRGLLARRAFLDFIGAFLAFLFGIRQRERQRVNQEVMAGNLALSTLYEMWERQLGPFFAY
jgi:hypothetical protein